MKIARPLLLVPAALALALGVTACEDDAPRPTRAAVVEVLELNGHGPGAAGCAADVLLGSELSDGSLADLVEANTPLDGGTASPGITSFSYEVREGDLAVAEALVPELDSCFALQG